MVGLSGLVGLLQGGFKLSILPPELIEARAVKNQLATFRSMTLILITTLSLMAYFSFIFAISLRANANSKVVYTDAVRQRIVEESKTVGTQVSEINSLINRLIPLESRRSQYRLGLAPLYAQKNNIVIEKISSQNPMTIVVEASGSDQSLVTSFIDGLKQETVFGEIKQELLPSPTNLSNNIYFRLTMTLKGAL